jgi:glutamyl-Q tRNA(Asp) synthetase
MRPVFRFAPSPNGFLHIGHAFSALLNARMARANRGRMLLRIEDIDLVRCRPDFETAIYEDLAWLGLQWEMPVRRQSEQHDDYCLALKKLEAMDLVYPTFESRAEIARMIAIQETRAPWPRDPDGAPIYPGNVDAVPVSERKRRMNAGEPYALRLDMRSAVQLVRQLSWTESGAGPAAETGVVVADPSIWGDVILARKETPTSYHLSVVVDDAAQGVTDVVRGLDLFHSTSVHRLLQALLNLPEPHYHHHRLVLDPAGNKLSKSNQSTGLRELRGAGAAPAEIRRLVGLD